MKEILGLIIFFLFYIGCENTKSYIEKKKVNNYDRAVLLCPACDPKFAYYLGQKYVDTGDLTFEEAYNQSREDCELFAGNFDSIGWWGIPDTAWWVNPPFFKKSN